MRLFLKLTATLALSASAAFAQYEVPPPPAAYPPANSTAQPPNYPPPPNYLAPNLPQLLASLSDQPATHAGFAFNPAMLQVAQGVLESNGVDERHAAAAITGVSIDNYHYQQPAFYTPEAMAALIETYRAAGWKHLVDGNQTPANSAQPKNQVLDLWLHYHGADVDALTVLNRSSHAMNVIQITGDLRPLDLLHLAGHFGIPKVSPDAIMVPDNAPPPPAR